MIISRSVLPSMRNVADKSCRENQNTHYLVSNIFRNRAVYELMWKATVELDRPQMIIWHMRIACWIAKATNTHSEFVMLIVFPRQQGLRERA